MLRIFAAIAAFFLCFSPCTGQAAAAASKLNWMTSFEEASLKAKREKKTLLLFFTGSDWCGWCHKLENEALDTTEFSDTLGDQFIFLVVDFPLKTPLDQKISAQNKDLQKQYDVKGFPTIILLDENGQKIGNTGYLPGGGKAYAEHLKKMVSDFKGYKQKLSKINSTTEAKELESLYGKAFELCRKQDAQRIVNLGLKTKDNRFFLLEKLKLLADEGQLHLPEARFIREQLLSTDPDNLRKTHYEVAVIEFESFNRDLEKTNDLPEDAITPLVRYIDQFGETDPENTWQLQMIIAQVYLDKNRLSDALKYAKFSHAAAPEAIQPDIQRFIVNIQR